MIMDAAGNVSANGSLTEGAYCIVITDGNGCITEQECFEITSEPGIIIEVYSTGNVHCDSLGSIYLNVFGGTPPYVFEWSDFATTQNRAELEEGIYSVVTTDANGCSAELQNLVIENDCPSTSEILSLIHI